MLQAVYWLLLPFQAQLDYWAREFGGGDLIGWAFTLYLLGSILAGSSSGH